MRAGLPSDAVLMKVEQAPRLAEAVIRWQRRHGRHHLPWQQSRRALGFADRPDADVLRDPYRVWLSEVMLQQTQVATVIPYFEAFLRAYPTVMDLAAADPEEVMGLWAGLGYYSRARNLLAAARQVAAAGGRFPESTDGWAKLPGVGRSTAAAVATFAYGARAAILDGNVKRVLCRVFAVSGDPAEAATLRRLWACAEAELPPPGTAPADLIAYTQGMMDLGAMVCTRSRPGCTVCPLASLCRAWQQGEPTRYPSPRQRRSVSVRPVNLLWLADGQNQVLLQVRPDKGIWGGLWSLPEWPQEVPQDWQAQGRFTHQFTHFRMDAAIWSPPPALVRALLAHPDRWGNDDLRGWKGLAAMLAKVLPAPAQQRWVGLKALDRAPLPRPIQRWLQARAAQPRLATWSG